MLRGRRFVLEGGFVGGGLLDEGEEILAGRRSLRGFVVLGGV